MSIYDLPHTFIVFHPGAAGNFIAGLVNNVINGTYVPLSISTSGASHTIIESRIAGTDYLSMGFDSLDNARFSSIDERIDYYVQYINCTHANAASPIVTWTHDFTNIPLYRQLFPNSKVIVVTQNSNLEKLAVIGMHVTKNILDPTTVIPMPPTDWAIIKRALYTGYADEINQMYNMDGCKSTFNMVYDPQYLDSVTYIALMRMYRYYRLLHLVEPGMPAEDDVVNHVLFPQPTRIPSFKQGLPCSTYIDADCVQFEYKHIMNNNSDEFLAMLSNFGKITDESRRYIVNSCNTYVAKQNQQLINDPVSYYNHVKNLGMTNLNKLSEDMNS